MQYYTNQCHQWPLVNLGWVFGGAFRWIWGILASPDTILVGDAGFYLGTLHATKSVSNEPVLCRYYVPSVTAFAGDIRVTLSIFHLLIIRFCVFLYVRGQNREYQIFL